MVRARARERRAILDSDWLTLIYEYSIAYAQRSILIGRLRANQSDYTFFMTQVARKRHLYTTFMSEINFINISR